MTTHSLAADETVNYPELREITDYIFSFIGGYSWFKGLGFCWVIVDLDFIKQIYFTLRTQKYIGSNLQTIYFSNVFISSCCLQSFHYFWCHFIIYIINTLCRSSKCLPILPTIFLMDHQDFFTFYRQEFLFLHLLIT